MISSRLGRSDPPPRTFRWRGNRSVSAERRGALASFLDHFPSTLRRVRWPRRTDRGGMPPHRNDTKAERADVRPALGKRPHHEACLERRAVDEGPTRGRLPSVRLGRADALPAQRRRRDPGDWREVLRQPRHGHRLAPDPPGDEPRARGRTSRACARVRLRRGERAVRRRVASLHPADHPKDRQGPSALLRRDRLRRLPPLGRGGSRAHVARRSGAGRLHGHRRRRDRAALPTADRRRLCAH